MSLVCILVLWPSDMFKEHHGIWSRGDGSATDKATHCSLCGTDESGVSKADRPGPEAGLRESDKVIG